MEIGSLEVIKLVVSGGVAVAIINFIQAIVMWKLGRKANADDKKKTAVTVETARMDALEKGVRLLLLDRIRDRGAAYIKDKEIDYDDRHVLNMMHDTYHDDLNGNGDAKLVMEAVNKLPLK